MVVGRQQWFSARRFAAKRSHRQFGFTPGNQAFVLTGNGGTDPFDAPGQLRWFQSVGNTVVQASNDGDLSPEMAITISGLFTLTLADFVL